MAMYDKDGHRIWELDPYGSLSPEEKLDITPFFCTCTFHFISPVGEEKFTGATANGRQRNFINPTGSAINDALVVIFKDLKRRKNETLKEFADNIKYVEVKDHYSKVIPKFIYDRDIPKLARNMTVDDLPEYRTDSARGYLKNCILKWYINRNDKVVFI